MYYLIYGGYPMLFVYTTFFLVYFYDRVYNKGQGFTRFEWWAMIMLTYILVVSGVMANIYYGQPIFTGMKSEKSWLAILSGFLWFYMLKTKAIDLSIVKDALLLGAWVQLPVFMTMVITMNPNKYNGTLWVYCNSVKGGCQFEFDIMVFSFASIYYFIRFVRTNKLWFGVFFVIFYSYIFFVNQKRGTSLALLGTVGLYFLIYQSWDKIIYYTLLSVTVLVAGVTLLYYIRPDIIARVLLEYGDVVAVLTGHHVAEASAEARIRESAIAFKYFDRNHFSWLFGNGKTDHDWAGQPPDLYHYYPSDIGIIGIIWQFGVVGFLLGFYQYYLVFRHHMRIKSFKKSSFYQAILFFLVFFIVRGIPTGGSWFDPGIATAATFVVLHYFFYYIELHPERGYVRPV